MAHSETSIKHFIKASTGSSLCKVALKMRFDRWRRHQRSRVGGVRRDCTQGIIGADTIVYSETRYQQGVFYVQAPLSTNRGPPFFIRDQDHVVFEWAVLPCQVVGPRSHPRPNRGAHHGELE